MLLSCTSKDTLDKFDTYIRRRSIIELQENEKQLFQIIKSTNIFTERIPRVYVHGRKLSPIAPRNEYFQHQMHDSA